MTPIPESEIGEQGDTARSALGLGQTEYSRGGTKDSPARSELREGEESAQHLERWFQAWAEGYREAFLDGLVQIYPELEPSIPSAEILPQIRWEQVSPEKKFIMAALLRQGKTPELREVQAEETLNDASTDLEVTVNFPALRREISIWQGTFQVVLPEQPLAMADQSAIRQNVAYRVAQRWNEWAFQHRSDFPNGLFPVWIIIPSAVATTYRWTRDSKRWGFHVSDDLEALHFPEELPGTGRDAILRQKSTGALIDPFLHPGLSAEEIQQLGKASLVGVEILHSFNVNTGMFDPQEFGHAAWPAAMDGDNVQTWLYKKRADKIINAMKGRLLGSNSLIFDYKTKIRLLRDETNELLNEALIQQQPAVSGASLARLGVQDPETARNAVNAAREAAAARRIFKITVDDLKPIQTLLESIQSEDSLKGGLKLQFAGEARNAKGLVQQREFEKAINILSALETHAEFPNALNPALQGALEALRSLHTRFEASLKRSEARIQTDHRPWTMDRGLKPTFRTSGL